MQRLGRGVCKTCAESIDNKLEDLLEERKNSLTEQNNKTQEDQITRAINGVATESDILKLKADGYLFIKERIVSCPICGERKFQEHQALLNTRLATFFSLDWMNRAATANICIQCGHILWFTPTDNETA